MSFQRYINAETILSLNGARYGQLFTDTDLSAFNDIVLIPTDPSIIANQVSELHIYSFYGDYITGNHAASYTVFEKNTNSLLLNVGKTFKEANIQKGSYLVVSNLFQPLWGKFDREPVYVREISPDRTEIKFVIDQQFTSQLNTFKDQIDELKKQDVLNNLVVNFGFNRIQKIINIRFDENDNKIFYVKLYQPLFDEIIELNKAFFVFEVVDPYIDSITFSSPAYLGNVNVMQGPNYYLDTSQFTGESTIFKSWEDMLDSNLPTTQQIIDQTLSSSNLVRLNIDYTDFNNFVFYSSAKERINNFIYKIGKIEEYSSSINLLNSNTASNTTFVSGSRSINQKRIDQITTTFDPFEKWMYYSPTSSIFSHDVTGSVTPYPKRLISNKYVNYELTSSTADNWYNNLIAEAAEYDQLNMNRLYWSIPEHIIMDVGNSDFILFMDMVGQHYDTLYSYIKALTQIHERDEHPARGFSNDLSYYIAKSFGWNLQNTKQLSDLWKYKLGTEKDGTYIQSGSYANSSHEEQSQQIWRRIVNNLPYLLKTKGTERSIKAMMSIYGIPQTLISIKEYGGATLEGNLIEDKYQYEANFTGSNWIEFPRRILPPSSGSWGGIVRVPDTVEFNFRTNYTGSVSMSLWAIEDGTDRSKVLANVQIVHKKYIDGTSSYSGSDDYGKIKLNVARWSQQTNIISSISTGYSEYIPIFDDSLWTVKIHTNTIFTQSNSTQASTVYITVSKADDCFSGIVTHSGSAMVSHGVSTAKFAYSWGAGSGSATTPHITLLGGTTGSLSGTSSRFVGQISGYKEYFTNLQTATYHTHVLNPQSYNDDTSTGSYYTLFRYFPLGLDNQRWDHSTYINVSSSQPNRIASFDTTGSFIGWSGSQSDQYLSFTERYYIQTPTLGGQGIKSNKVRFDESRLIRDLSPATRSDISKYDTAPYDTNRLAIVFSPTDQINNEIYNHTGFTELDDYVGDPQYEFEEGYSELKRFGNEYFKKYQQKTDINKFIKLFSIYDFTFFDQIKQLIPGRADYIGGILIEDDTLHRNKVIVTKRPEISNPQYYAEYNLDIFTSSAENLTYEATASNFVEVDFVYKYLTSSLQPETELTFQYKYLTSSIQLTYPIEGQAVNYPDTGSYPNGLCAEFDTLPTRFSGSQSPTQSYVDHYRLNCCYKKVNYHYSASGQFATNYLKQWYTAVSKSYGWYYSRSLECTDYPLLEECATENYKRFYGTKLSGLGINIDSPETLDGGPVVSIFVSNNKSLYVDDNNLSGNLKVE